jgi:hypothetical protein
VPLCGLVAIGSGLWKSSVLTLFQSPLLCLPYSLAKALAIAFPRSHRPSLLASYIIYNRREEKLTRREEDVIGEQRM